MTFKDKKVLVAGGTGLIGRSLVKMLMKEGAKVRVASLEKKGIKDTEHIQTDLTKYENCYGVCKGMEDVFNLLCIKGSPKFMKEKPALVFDSMLLFNTNLMKAAKESRVNRYLFTSTVGVYAPGEVSHEEDVWKTFPSEHDKFAGWAKRMGELQTEAYKIEHGWDKISIVRPANTYGPYDNFDLTKGATVVPSLIKRANNENPLNVWGDGTAIRDFIYCDDVARGMLLVMEKGITSPINLGSGNGYSIKELLGKILKYTPQKPEIIWDISKPTGDKKRVLDITRAKSIGWKPEVSLDEGIRRTIKWYRENRL